KNNTGPAETAGPGRVLGRLNRASSTSTAFIGAPPVCHPSAVPDTRVEPRVAEIDQDVDGDEDHGVQEHDVLHHDDVALDHRGNEGSSEARDAERLLDRHGTAEHEA